MKVLVILFAVIEILLFAAASSADSVARSADRTLYSDSDEASCYDNADCSFNMGAAQTLDRASCRAACAQNPLCRGWVTYEGSATTQCSMKYAKCTSAQRSLRSGATLCEKSGKWPRCYKDTDCAGWDFAISDQPMDPMQCQTECSNRPNCRGWLSYHRAGASRCWIKTHACTPDQMTVLDGATWCERGPTCYKDTDCAGFDFEISDRPMSARACADACENNPVCRGWLAYARDGAMRCWMKYHACTAEQRSPLRGGTWCEKPVATEPALKCYKNTDCTGFDFATSDRPMDAKSCLEACTSNDQCRGWITYNRAGAMRCWLKDYACDQSQRTTLAGATWCEKPRYDPGPKCYRNTDCAGFDFDISNEPMSAQECQNACLERRDCRGWLSYHRAGALRCWLKTQTCTAAQLTILAGATWCERGPICYKNTDCAGFDFAISDKVMSPESCAQVCNNNINCRGWLSYARNGALRCWLKYNACSATQRTTLPGATWCEKEEVPEPAIKCHKNTDCRGFDFAITGTPMNPVQCKEVCLSKSTCNGWLSYPRHGAMRCWLKRHACTAVQMTVLRGATWCERGPTCYKDTDCAGFDFEISDQPMSAAACAEACENSPNCRGWVRYARPGQLRCWLKYHACTAEQRTSLKGATWCEKPEFPKPALKCYKNTDCAGFDFAISDRPMDAKSCLEACASNDKCRGWITYNRAGAMRCWLKNYACDQSQRTTLAGATWCEKPRYDPGPKCYRNTDCRGHDYALSAESMSSEACQNACLDRSDCKGWITFHRENALRCWLKNHKCNSNEVSVLQGATWCERGPLCYQNIDCRGYDFSIGNEPMLPVDCARECEVNSSCRGWLVYYRDGALKCWLKNHACTAAERSILPGATWCVKP